MAGKATLRVISPLPRTGGKRRESSVYLVIPPVGVPIGLVRNARASSHATLRWPTQMSGALRGPWGLAPTSTNRWMVGSLLVAYFGSLVACFVASPPAFILGYAVRHARAAVVKWCRFNVAKYRATAEANEYELSIEQQLKRMKREFVDSCWKSTRLKQIAQQLNQVDFMVDVTKALTQALTVCMVLNMLMGWVSAFFMVCTFFVVTAPLAFFVAPLTFFVGWQRRELVRQELAEKKRLHALVFDGASQRLQRGASFWELAPFTAAARALRTCLPKEEKMCRLCWGDEADGPLVQPCGCRGSQKWAHEHCLGEWGRTCVNEDAVYRCGLCMKEYCDHALSLKRLQERTAPGQANGWMVNYRLPWPRPRVSLSIYLSTLNVESLHASEWVRVGYAARYGALVGWLRGLWAAGIGLVMPWVVSGSSLCLCVV